MARNPTRIGRYDLVTTLATGGMGRIYLARATGLGGFERKVVVKTLEHPVDSDADPAVAMFLDEARLLGLLHHHHIASVFEVGRDDDGRHYMVLEYVDGKSAHDVWERTVELGAALPLDFALTVVSAAANGLSYAHTRKDENGAPLGIVHRDVTPSNVMIGHDGAVKLIDFGIAMAADKNTTTQTGFVKGKIGYLAPEQVAGRDVDARTDVFALGILLYELTTLRWAFRDTSDLATMQRIKLGKVVPPSQVASDYPTALEAIVMKALELDPRDRFGDADAMRRAIEALGHRLHFVLGDAAVIEVMAQLYEAKAPGASQRLPPRDSEPTFDWTDSDRDLTVRRDPSGLVAAMRAEIAGSGAAVTQLPSPLMPSAHVVPRKLRAATEAADTLTIPSASAYATPLTPTPVRSVTEPRPVAKPATEEPVPADDPLPTDKPLPAGPVAEPLFTDKPLPAGPVAKRRPARKPMAVRPVQREATQTPPIGASLVRARTQRSSRLRWIVATAVLCVLGVGGYAVMQASSSVVTGSTSPPASPSTQARTQSAALPIEAPTPPAPPSPPGPVPSSPPAPATVSPPTPDKVRVRIVTHPPDVTVLLDGKKLGHTPLDETIAADPGKHVIKLRRRGYVTQLLDVGLDADVTQNLTLAPQK